MVKQSSKNYEIKVKPSEVRADVRRLMKRRIGMKIGVAVEARHAKALVRRLAVLGLIEFLLGERRQQQAHAFELHRREDTHHQCIVILDREQASLGYVAQFGMRGEINGRRKLRREMVGQIEVDIEAPQTSR